MRTGFVLGRGSIWNSRTKLYLFLVHYMRIYIPGQSSNVFALSISRATAFRSGYLSHSIYLQMLRNLTLLRDLGRLPFHAGRLLRKQFTERHALPSIFSGHDVERLSDPYVDAKTLYLKMISSARSRKSSITKPGMKYVTGLT